MSNDDDILEAVIDGAKEATCAKDCRAHGPFLTVLSAVAACQHNTNTTVKRLADVSEDTNGKVSALKDKIDSQKKLDPKDVFMWIKVIGYAALVIFAIHQMFNGAKQQKATDLLLKLNGVDVARMDIDTATDILTKKASKEP
jgi:hypothetical protein